MMVRGNDYTLRVRYFNNSEKHIQMGGGWSRWYVRFAITFKGEDGKWYQWSYNLYESYLEKGTMDELVSYILEKFYDDTFIEPY